MEQKKIDMNKVAETYAQVFGHIMDAQEILEKLIPLISDGNDYSDRVDKLVNDFLSVAHSIAEQLLSDSVVEIDMARKRP
ncbi:MAG: hypothetical protein ACI35P_04305 [Bacillus sp. (in: firmicutes)]